VDFCPAQNRGGSPAWAYMVIEVKEEHFYECTGSRHSGNNPATQILPLM